MAVKELTKANFDAELAANKITVVDFWAQWCNPCLNFAETYQRVALKFPDIAFTKVDIEKETELASDFNVRSIPFLMIFKENIALYAESGSLSEQMLTKLLEDACKIDISEVKAQITQEDH